MSFLGFTNAHLAEFQRELNSAVLKDMRSNKDNIAITVLAVDITKKESKSRSVHLCVYTRAARYIACDSHAYLISKDSSVISRKSPSTVFKWSGI